MPQGPEKSPPRFERRRIQVGSQRTDVADCLRKGAEAASRLGMAKDVEEARQHFAEVSQYLVSLAAADTRLREGWHLFECPMAEGFNKWLQREPRLENPYMGKRMLACGSRSEWTVTVPASPPEGHSHEDGAVAHYTCPMHPAVRQAGPGQCPICGMDLTPVTQAEVESGVILIDDARRQRIGLKTARVERRADGPLPPRARPRHLRRDGAGGRHAQARRLHPRSCA